MAVVLDDPSMTKTHHLITSLVATLAGAMGLALSNGVNFGNGIAAFNGVSFGNGIVGAVALAAGGALATSRPAAQPAVTVAGR
jgi:hypothetical protein